MSRNQPAWTVLSMLKWATDYFEKEKVISPRHSIEWLLAHVLDVKRLDLYLLFDRPLSPKELDKLRPLVKRRASHEPLQYITGEANFMGCSIDVTPDVLIPRIETEQLVEILLTETESDSDKNLTLLDIGSGSGCIPIAIKKSRPNWDCFGMDISAKALQTARNNAEKNSVEVNFLSGDLMNLSPFVDTKWDIIISNPPYIHPSEIDTVEKQVRDFEPKIALFHDTPLDVYKAILSFTVESGSQLYLECNHTTADEIKSIAQLSFQHVELKSDLDGNPRFIIAH